MIAQNVKVREPNSGPESTIPSPTSELSTDAAFPSTDAARLQDGRPVDLVHLVDAVQHEQAEERQSQMSHESPSES